jgi:hypothetical protein
MPKHTPEQIQFIADSLMPGFVPKDQSESTLTFAFTADSSNYEVIYKKNSDAKWQFASYKKA